MRPRPAIPAAYEVFQAPKRHANDAYGEVLIGGIKTGHYGEAIAPGPSNAEVIKLGEPLSILADRRSVGACPDHWRPIQRQHTLIASRAIDVRPSKIRRKIKRRQRCIARDTGFELR